MEVMHEGEMAEVGQRHLQDRVVEINWWDNGVLSVLAVITSLLSCSLSLGFAVVVLSYHIPESQQ